MVDIRLGEPNDRVGAKRDEVTLRTDFGEPGGLHKSRKLPREDRITTAASNELDHCATAFPRNLDVGFVGRIQRLEDRRHQLLDQQPAAGLQRRDHPHQRGSPFGNERQYRPGVNDVEGAFGQRIDADVVAAQLDIARL